MPEQSSRPNLGSLIQTLSIITQIPIGNYMHPLPRASSIASLNNLELMIVCLNFRTAFSWHFLLHTVMARYLSHMYSW